MDALAAADETPIASFSGRRSGKPRIPRERNDNAAPVGEIDGSLVFSD
jgi:hypothetical protein